MSTSKPLRVPRFVGLLLLLALFILAVWGLKSRGASRPPEELVRLAQVAPGEAPQTLGDSLANGAIAQLDVVLEEARKGMMQETPSIEAGSRAEFEQMYLRHQHSAIGSLLETPESARSEELVRSAELNPHDVEIHAQAIENLDRLVTAYRDVIMEAIELRNVESHHRTLLLANSEGLISVDSLRGRMPSKTHKEISHLAREQDPTEGPEYTRIRLAFEARFFQDLLNADVVLIHGGVAYLAPEGSVLPGIAHYKEFVTERTVAMIYDVLEFFSTHGTISDERVAELLASLDEVIAADPHGDSQSSR